MDLIWQTVARSADEPTLKHQPGSESGSYSGQQRHERGSVHRLESRYIVARSLARRVMLTLTVDESDWVRTRKTIMSSGGGDVELLKVRPVAHTTVLRIQIGLESDALDGTMSRIMRSLNAAEFGPVVAIQHRESSDQSTAASH